jgi:hypothetical protein
VIRKIKQEKGIEWHSNNLKFTNNLEMLWKRFLYIVKHARKK